VKNRISSLVLSLILPIIILIPRAALAEHIAMTATGEYTMGDNDTYIEAKQLALQDAKHILFKNIETYIGSKTGVSIGDIGPYLPGMVDIEEIGAARTILKNKTIVATVIVKALVDPDAIMGQVASLRDKKDIEASA